MGSFQKIFGGRVTKNTMDMIIVTDISADSVTIKFVEANLTEFTIKQLKKELNKAESYFDKAKKVIFDLNNVQYISSSGIGLFINIKRNYFDKHEDKEMLIINVAQQVSRMLDLLHIQGFLNIEFGGDHDNF